jgi:hypothetical protein
MGPGSEAGTTMNMTSHSRDSISPEVCKIITPQE